MAFYSYNEEISLILDCKTERELQITAKILEDHKREYTIEDLKRLKSAINAMYASIRFL